MTEIKMKAVEIKDGEGMKFGEGTPRSLAVQTYSLNPKIIKEIVEHFKVLNKIKYTSTGNIEFKGITKEGEQDTYVITAGYLMENILCVHL